eukprot:CAMPEP_0117025556 /NCGR_PEP_ID=MMETSP0472-20121206/18869_1 /TAXON_ID=693140 ORGANISM="Tiarina fusus, Strain LIS" /NCGR_SAMPLE_ID=MMETSP0472 /ASSEMBLY_ACC=CAM_ASM_000603 /LENGTH=223 /DNA_ID=CAMNT_0004732309 /DNA_START=129 /DNA_END=800 /DNA_ORIENTATION=-
MASNGEGTPLLGGEKNNYYFLQNGEAPDHGAVVDGMPPGAQPDAFEPKVLSNNLKHPSFKEPPQQVDIKTTHNSNNNNGGGFLDSIFGFGGGGKKSDPIHNPPMMVKQRKAPIKVEPKVFFANERTFLAWTHISIILAGASIAILALNEGKASTGSQLYGIITLPVAVAFIIYSMYQYVRRAYMIRNKHPGPYDDTFGPTVLSILLMLSIIAQFAIKLYAMSA